MRANTSARVASLVWMSPRTALVTVLEPGVRTPRMLMQRCSASMSTSAPVGCRDASMARGWLKSISPLLQLRTRRHLAHHARQLAQPGDVTVVTRDVGHVRAPVERQQMVLADRVEVDVLDEHHLAMVVSGDRREQLRRVGRADAGEDVDVHVGDPLRRLLQPRTVRVLADAFKDEAYAGLYLLAVQVAGAVAGCQVASGLTGLT